MPSLQRKKSLGPPLLGLNDILDLKVIDDNEASECINARLNFHGILEKFPGYIKDGSPFPNSADSFIRTMINFKRGTSVDWLLVAAQDDNNSNSTYKVDFKYTVGDGNYNYIGHTVGTASFVHNSTSVTGTGTDWSTNLKAGDKIKVTADPDTDYTEIFSVNSDTSITLVTGYPGTTSTTQPYIARIILDKNSTPAATVFDDLAIIVDGIDVMMSYDSITLNLINGFFSAFAENSPKFVEPHKNRLFSANVPGAPSNIYWSASFDPTSYDPAAFTPVFPQDNGSIVAIKSFSDSLIVVKDNGKLYQVVGNFDTDPGTFSYIRRIDYPDKTIGTIAGRSVTVHKGNLFFLAEGGLFVLDQRMVISRFNRNAETFISGLNFGASGAAVPKSYPYMTNAQWSAGTFDGTHVTSNGKLEPFFDSLFFPDASQAKATCSVAIDSTNIVHAAYVGTNQNINYIRWNPDNTYTVETALLSNAQNIQFLCIDVAANGNVGVAYSYDDGNMANPQRSFFVERTSGTWGLPTQIASWTRSPFVPTIPITFRYASDNLARVAYIDSTNVTYATKASGSFVLHAITTSHDSDTARTGFLSMAIDGGGRVNVSMFQLGTGSPGSTEALIDLYYTDNDGTSFINLEKFDTGVENTGSGNVIQYSKLQTETNSSNQVITGYCLSGSVGGNLTANLLLSRNHTLGTTNIISSRSEYLQGFRVGYSDDNFTYSGDVSSSMFPQEHYIYENNQSIENFTAPQIGVSITSPYGGDRGLVSNGKVFASVAFTRTSNQLVIRRLAFHSTWTSQQLSDSGLTAWGLYQAVYSMAGSNTVNFYIALASSPPANTFNLITPGTVISSNNTLIDAATKVEFILSQFSQPTVTSVVLNYSGSSAGNDPKEPVAISHNAELYTACAQMSSPNNNFVLVLDIGDALTKSTYFVNTLERYKSKLYAGSSTTGDVYILLQGLDFNGASYAMDVQTKEFFLDSVDTRKDGYKIYVLYNVQPSGTLTFSYRLDNFLTPGGAPWVPVSIDITGASGLPGLAEIPIGGNLFKSIQLRYQNSEAGTAIQVISQVLVYGYVYQR